VGLVRPYSITTVLAKPCSKLLHSKDFIALLFFGETKPAVLTFVYDFLLKSTF
jgi:hypothetical protein